MIILLTNHQEEPRNKQKSELDIQVLLVHRKNLALADSRIRLENFVL